MADVELKYLYDIDFGKYTTCEDFEGDINPNLVKVVHLPKMAEGMPIEWENFEDYAQTKRPAYKIIKYRYVDFMKVVYFISMTSLGEGVYEALILTRTYDYGHMQIFAHDFSRCLFQKIKIKADMDQLAQYLQFEVVIRGREYQNAKNEKVWDVFSVVPAVDYENIHLFYRIEERDINLVKEFLSFQKQNPDVTKINDRQLKNERYKRENVENMSLEAIDGFKIKFIGNETPHSIEENMTVPRIFFSDDKKFCVAEVWRKELYALCVVVYEGNGGITCKCIDSWENKEYGGSSFETFWIEWNMEMSEAEVYSIDPETTKIRKRKTFKFKSKGDRDVSFNDT